MADEDSARQCIRLRLLLSPHLRVLDAIGPGSGRLDILRRGIVGADPIGVLAHLQLGRAFAHSGDIARARLAYSEFLTIWKGADPDVPILVQAKTEYARLQ